MITALLNETELAILYWYRGLNKWQTAAINLWLMTGDGSQIAVAFTPHHRQAVA